MKVKDLIENWQKEVEELKKQSDKVKESTTNLKDDVKNLTTKIDALVDVTREMADLVIMLIRNQMGD